MIIGVVFAVQIAIDVLAWWRNVGYRNDAEEDDNDFTKPLADWIVDILTSCHLLVVTVTWQKLQ